MASGTPCDTLITDKFIACRYLDLYWPLGTIGIGIWLAGASGIRSVRRPFPSSATSLWTPTLALALSKSRPDTIREEKDLRSYAKWFHLVKYNMFLIFLLIWTVMEQQRRCSSESKLQKGLLGLNSLTRVMDVESRLACEGTRILISSRYWKCWEREGFFPDPALASVSDPESDSNPARFIKRYGIGFPIFVSRSSKFL